MARTDWSLKYRPATWEDVVGQPEVVTVLRKQVEAGEIPQCLIFTGMYGRGKTSIARVLANYADANVIEMDAASNGGIDQIRDLKTDIQYLPIDGKRRKMYIIDEAGTMGKASAEAMLKMLEEPPAHVIFALCTTDPQKLPVTILSRCQRMDLRNLSQDDVIARLNYICKKEEVNATNDALVYIAEQTGGGMRDAIKLLQKCSYSDQVTVDTVVDALGSVDRHSIENLVSDMQPGTVTNAIAQFRAMLAKGVDVRILLNNVIRHMVDMDILFLTQLDIKPKYTKQCEQLFELMYRHRDNASLRTATELFLLQIEVG